VSDRSEPSFQHCSGQSGFPIIELAAIFLRPTPTAPNRPNAAANIAQSYPAYNRRNFGIQYCFAGWRAIKQVAPVKFLMPTSTISSCFELILLHCSDFAARNCHKSSIHPIEPYTARNRNESSVLHCSELFRSDLLRVLLKTVANRTEPRHQLTSMVL